jgi:uncharacterized protein YjbI with pentapeptide repeats
MSIRQTWLACTLSIALTTACPAKIFRWDNGQQIPGTEGIVPGPNVQLNDRQLEFADSFRRNLTGASFERSDLTAARLTLSTLTNANLSGAIVTATDFSQTTFRGFTKKQLYSTAGYQHKRLQGISLGGNDLIAWDFSGQNLSGASLNISTLTDAEFAGAVVTGASFSDTTRRGFTKEQFYSTASYQAKNLAGIGLGRNQLTGWDFHEQNLTGANFHESTLSSVDLSGANLTNAQFDRADLTNADLAGANLSNSKFNDATLTDASLVGTIVKGADFHGATSRGLSQQQFYSTASYQNKDLHGVRLGGNDMTSWGFSGQDLTGAYLNATLSNADLTGATLTDADLRSSRLTNANLTDALVAGAAFWSTTSSGFTKEQLYSTASYQAKKLQGIDLGGNDLTGWDFRGQDLTGAVLSSAALADAKLTDAVVVGADFSGTTSSGFTKEQLYSTASYKAKDLRGIGLGGSNDPWFGGLANDLTAWDFSGQNLANSYFALSDLTNAVLTGANLSNAFFSSPWLIDANFTGADMRGAQGLDLTEAVSRNAILPDGKIAGLELGVGERMLVRDYDGLADPSSKWWLEPHPPIPVSIEDRLTMGEDSVLQLQFDSDPWDSLISFQPGIPVQLGGALELTFAAGVDSAKQVGRTLRIFDWTGVSPSGQFAIRSPYLWDTTNLYTSGEVRLVAVPEPAAASMIAILLVAGVAYFRRTVRVSH